MSDIKVANYEFGEKVWYTINDDYIDTTEHDAKLGADAYNNGYEKGYSDALDIDMEKPMHFTDEQKAWVKNYIIINAKRQREDAIENVKKYIRLKTHYHYADIKEDFLYAHEMYEWLDEQLKEQK